MDLARSLTLAAPGRHRAPRRPGRLGRAALAIVAAGAPVVPGVLLAPVAHAETDWDALAECESGGDWSIDTGNGFSGGLQFTPSTWRAFGGSGSPENASREEQIRVAERVKAEQGMNAWPTCSRKTGQTDDSPNSSVPSSSDSESSEESSSESSEETSSDETESVRQTSSSSASSSSASSSSAPEPSSGSYTVQAGDTLSSIAASQGTTWRALASGNTDVISDPNMILPGQTLSMA